MVLKNRADQYNALADQYYRYRLAVWSGYTNHLGRVRGASETSPVFWVTHPFAVRLHIELTHGQLYPHSGGVKVKSESTQYHRSPHSTMATN